MRMVFILLTSNYKSTQLTSKLDDKGSQDQYRVLHTHFELYTVLKLLNIILPV